MKQLVRELMESREVHKGDVFSRNELGRLFGMRPNDYRNFQPLVADFECELQRQLRAAGRPFTVAQIRTDVVVLTDTDAAEHNAKRFNGHKRGLFRRHDLAMAVDQSALSPEDARRHDRRLTTQAAILAGIEQSRSAPTPEPYRRTTPGLESYRQT